MDCEHDWVNGPFYITVASTFDEPDFCPPSRLAKVEHCTKCGVIRLPEETRKKTGKNLTF